MNAAESFVTQEGFGRDAVALPVDELRARRAGRARASTRTRRAELRLRPTPLRARCRDRRDLSPLAAFLTHAALESGDNQAQAGQDAVQLMTVHAAKGLEFDCVFITGLEEGLFPHENSMSDHDGLEEERRLMYVAITRARKRLYLSYSQTRMLHGQTRYNVKSRFFDELPEAALKWLTPQEPGLRLGLRAFGYSAAWRAARGWQSIVGTAASDAFASPPVPPQKAAPSHGLRSGMQVFHNKFGEGMVIDARRQRRRRARADQLRPPRHEVAGAVGRQADAGGLKPARPEPRWARRLPMEQTMNVACTLTVARCAALMRRGRRLRQRARSSPRNGAIPSSAPGFLHGARMLVACDAAELVVRQICQDQLASEVVARGATPVFVAPGFAVATDRSLDGQLLPAAREAGAKAMMVMTVAVAVNDVSQGFSIGIGGFGFGRNSGVGVGVSAPIGGGRVTSGYSANGRVTDVASGRLVWTAKATAPPSSDVNAQMGDSSKAVLGAADKAGLF